MAYNYLEDHSDGVLSKLLETNCILEFLGRGDACILADLHSCMQSIILQGAIGQFPNV